MDLQRKPALGRNVQDPHVHVTLAVRWTRRGCPKSRNAGNPECRNQDPEILKPGMTDIFQASR